MINRTMGALGLVLAAGCMAPEPVEETGEVEQLGRCTIDPDGFECQDDCTGCGHNGLRKGSWDLLFNQFNHNTLRSYNLWIDPAPGVTSGAKSLCDPGRVYSDHCVMRTEYSQWIAASTHSRVDIMTHVVAAVARTDYRVQDPNGYGYWGNFGLRPEALAHTWDYRTQETITAALLAQLNNVSGVAICLVNEQAPNNCNSTDSPYHESDVYGNHFRYYFAGITGGAHAPNPYENLRFGSVADPNVNPADRVAFAYPYRDSNGAYRCNYDVSATGARYATSCLGENGAWYDYPVTVRTPKAPGTWFYPPTRSIERTAGWPLVPIEEK